MNDAAGFDITSTGSLLGHPAIQYESPDSCTWGNRDEPTNTQAGLPGISRVLVEFVTAWSNAPAAHFKLFHRLL